LHVDKGRHHIFHAVFLGYPITADHPTRPAKIERNLHPQPLGSGDRMAKQIEEFIGKIGDISFFINRTHGDLFNAKDTLSAHLLQLPGDLLLGDRAAEPPPARVGPAIVWRPAKICLHGIDGIRSLGHANHPADNKQQDLHPN